MGGHGQILWCDRCGIEITWAPRRQRERLYCCEDCAEGRACDCGADRLTDARREEWRRAACRV